MIDQNEIHQYCTNEQNPLWIASQWPKMETPVIDAEQRTSKNQYEPEKHKKKIEKQRKEYRSAGHSHRHGLLALSCECGQQ
jgi:hypothetical protein